MAESGGVDATWVGASAAIAAAMLAYAGTRKGRTGSTAELVASAMAIAEERREGEQSARSMITELRTEVRQLGAAVEACETKHAAAAAALRAAGIEIPGP